MDGMVLLVQKLVTQKYIHIEQTQNNKIAYDAFETSNDSGTFLGRSVSFSLFLSFAFTKFKTERTNEQKIAPICDWLFTLHMHHTCELLGQYLFASYSLFAFLFCFVLSGFLVTRHVCVCTYTGVYCICMLIFMMKTKKNNNNNKTFVPFIRYVVCAVCIHVCVFLLISLNSPY